jgi:predicted 2-oxoglutarate/Fe(II)-dependent dioxygenase YbiX
LRNHIAAYRENSRVIFRFEDVHRLHEITGRIDTGPLPPGFLNEAVLPILRRAGAHFGLPANDGMAQVMRYWPGSEAPWHRDRYVDAPAMWLRTVSLSVLLNDQGPDYSGGNLETSQGSIAASLGDAIAFTSMTEHRVTTIESGQRCSLVVFGSWNGHDPT